MPLPETRVDNLLQSQFLGLAPFLRRSIAGDDLQAFGQRLLATANASPDDANLWMNLAIATQCMGQRDIGLALQKQALALQRNYYLPATQQPACLRLLLLVADGDLSANTPLDCLFEHSDLDLILHFVDAQALSTVQTAANWRQQLPDHDVVMVGIGVASDTIALLQKLQTCLENWPKPVINLPKHILHTDRAVASELLQNAPGILMPMTVHCTRDTLQSIANGNQRLMAVTTDNFPVHAAGFDFPIIVRPVNSHGGHGLDKITDKEQLAIYLHGADAADFFVAPFIDYSGEDGYFRKIRIALVQGEPFACHMAVSTHWMVHYLNAGMYEEAWKRAEEAAFMSNFADFARRHHEALHTIFARSQLDYVCIDCAETRDGKLLIFEIDHSMVIHAMDLESQFPFKKTHMQKVQHALRHYILSTQVNQTEQCA